MSDCAREIDVRALTGAYTAGKDLLIRINSQD